MCRVTRLLSDCCSLEVAELVSVRSFRRIERAVCF
jgi:hypothetical protein